MTRYISFAVLLAIIIVIGALFYRVMIGFFVPVFLAAVLVVVFRPLHRWVLSRVGERDHLASGITTSLIVLIVLLPAGVVLSLAAVQGVRFVSNVNWNNIEYGLNKLRGNDLVNLDYPHADEVRAIQNKISEIQSLATSQTSMDSLKKEKETFQSDLKEIRRLLDEDLTPQLQEMPAAEAAKKIIKAQKSKTKNGSSPELAKDGTPTSPQLRAELKEYFERVTKQIRDKLAERESVAATTDANEPTVTQTPETFADVVAELQSQPLDPLNSLTQAENAILNSVRRNYIEQSVGWYQAKAELMASLDALEASKIQEFDIVQIQKSVLSATNAWNKSKEYVLGGSIVAVLKEIANPSPDQLKTLTGSFVEYISPKIVSITGDSFAFLIRLVIGASILLVALYFFFCDGPAMMRTIMDLSPLDDKYELELLAEFDRVSRAIVLATLLSALAQGLVAGLAYYFVGLDSLVLLIAVTSTCALIPFVGTAIVWVPVCIFLAAYQENYYAAIGVAIWGFLVVGSVDNLIKILILHGQSQLHPLLALLSVLGGIQTLGPVGILVGPMVVVLLQTLLGILRHELARFNKWDTDSGSGSGASPLSEKFRKLKLRGNEETSTQTSGNPDLTPPPLPS
ncbi:MAG: AI-2E family transporter [Pirellula sp.]|jgi:predicted PurR-regulated permease PerM|nr:AI-2E family transporter [Pirellula sp.]